MENVKYFFALLGVLLISTVVICYGFALAGLMTWYGYFQAKTVAEANIAYIMAGFFASLQIVEFIDQYRKSRRSAEEAVTWAAKKTPELAVEEEAAEDVFEELPDDEAEDRIAGN
jgi:hypothetical protein